MNAVITMHSSCILFPSHLMVKKHQWEVQKEYTLLQLCPCKWLSHCAGGYIVMQMQHCRAHQYLATSQKFRITGSTKSHGCSPTNTKKIKLLHPQINGIPIKGQSIFKNFRCHVRSRPAWSLRQNQVVEHVMVVTIHRWHHSIRGVRHGFVSTYTSIEEWYHESNRHVVQPVVQYSVMRRLCWQFVRVIHDERTKPVPDSHQWHDRYAPS